MMRAVAFVACAMLLVVLALGAMSGWHTLPFAVMPAILLFGLLFERYLYKPIRTDPPGEGWERTSERFVDPDSEQKVVVYYNARTGERRYVLDQG